MSGGNVSTARERRNSRLYLTLWGEGFVSPREGFREWRGNADVGFRLIPGLELGITGGVNYQTRDVGAYLSGSFSPVRNVEIVLRGHGGVSWGDVPSTQSLPNPTFTQWESRRAAHTSCIAERDRVLALNERRASLGLAGSPVPSCGSGPGSQPPRTITEERSTTELGFHVFAGLHAGYLLSGRVAAVLHVDVHYNSLVEPKADIHASLGLEVNLSPVILEAGCGVDGDGGFQCMLGATLAFNLFPAQPNHNHGEGDAHNDHEDHDDHDHEYDDHHHAAPAATPAPSQGRQP